jgi:hypothetical protein
VTGAGLPRLWLLRACAANASRRLLPQDWRQYDRPYRTAAAFRAALEEHIRTHAHTAGISIQRARKAVLFERLLARLSSHALDEWVLKGALSLDFPVRRTGGEVMERRLYGATNAVGFTLWRDSRMAHDAACSWVAVGSRGADIQTQTNAPQQAAQHVE